MGFPIFKLVEDKFQITLLCPHGEWLSMYLGWNGGINETDLISHKNTDKA